MPEQEHTFTTRVGHIDLNKEGTMMLHVPAGAFKQNTVVTWSLKEHENCDLSELDIVARDNDSGKEIGIFEKHVMIVNTKVQCSPENLTVSVDGEGLPKQQVTTHEGVLDDQCMFHTFYRATPSETTIFTRHFSKFRFCCNDDTYKATLFAALFQKQEATEGGVFVDVKVVLDVNNTDRKKNNKTNWKIHNSEDYELIETITLNTPPSQKVVVEQHGTFGCDVTVANQDWVRIEKQPATDPASTPLDLRQRIMRGVGLPANEVVALENVIPCKRCGDADLLPNAAVVQFACTRPKSFRAAFKFLVQPSEQGDATSTEHTFTIKVTSDEEPRVSQEASSDHQTSASTITTDGRTSPDELTNEKYQQPLEETFGDLDISEVRSIRRSVSLHSEKPAVNTTVTDSTVAPPEETKQIPKLTDEHIHKLATELNRDEMRRLGVKLGLSSTDMDTRFENHATSVTEAVQNILRTWLKKQKNRQIAFIALAEALTDKSVELHLLASEVLDYSAIDQTCA